jgi:hypothetical protein
LRINVLRVSGLIGGSPIGAVFWRLAQLWHSSRS